MALFNARSRAGGAEYALVASSAYVTIITASGSAKRRRPVSCPRLNGNEGAQPMALIICSDNLQFRPVRTSLPLARSITRVSSESKALITGTRRAISIAYAH